MKQDFLLEIGVEELPADELPKILDWDYPNSKGLASAAVKILTELQIGFGKLSVYGTPRRLVLRVDGVDSIIEETLEGPPPKVAFDSAGKPTPAAQGFAKKVGVKVSALTVAKTAKGERVVAKRKRAIAQVLGLAIPEIANGIAFEKTMRWDVTGQTFARPIRWVLALVGSRPVVCQIGEVKSGTVTFGTRRGVATAVKVTSAKSYFSAVQKLKVQLEQGVQIHASGQTTLDQTKRKTLLKKLHASAKKVGGQLADQVDGARPEFDWLLDSNSFLAEDPVVALGAFQKDYLSLPTPVLMTSMAKHLKVFGLFGSKKKLLPKFLAVLEGSPKQLKEVMGNYERILEARFSDAQFFYQEDTKNSLVSKAGELKSVVFHKQLGTLHEKSQRLQTLAGKLGQRNKPLLRAAQLAKVDLVTQMVREFPTLQGAMGAQYARHDGEDPVVVQALREQYLPRSAGDTIPSSEAGAWLSLLERADTLTGFFAIGMIPKSSEDPFALRRQALGLMRILIEVPVSLPLDTLFEQAIELWHSRLTVSSDECRKNLCAFVLDRYRWWLTVVEKRPRELVEAVLSAPSNDLADASVRLAVLEKLWSDSRLKTEVLFKAGKVIERAGQMVRSSKEAVEGSVDPSLFKVAEEKKLFEAWEKLSPEIEQKLADKAYLEATRLVAKLYPQVHQFFEKVFVMDEDAQVRRNRLLMLKKIYRLYADGMADLSRLPLPAEL